LFQHHDGITGTAKDKVVVDYGERMKEALDHTSAVIQHSSQALLLGSGIVADSLHFSLGESQNTQDSLPKPAVVWLALEGAQTVLVVNPLSSTSHKMIFITVDTHTVMVTDPRNVTVPCQISPVLGQDGSVSTEHYQLAFPATLPALGLVQYQLWPGSLGCSLAKLNTIHYTTQDTVFPADKDLDLQNIMLSTNHITATFSGSTGYLQSVAMGNHEVRLVLPWCCCQIVSLARRWALLWRW
jgi:alpha-mannosidase II